MFRKFATSFGHSDDPVSDFFSALRIFGSVNDMNNVKSYFLYSHCVFFFGGGFKDYVTSIHNSMIVFVGEPN